MARSRTNRAPALAASALLHAGVIAVAILLVQFGGRHVSVGPIVPVEIVNGPPADAIKAIEAPQPTPATTEAPEPTALTPPTPAPQPSPPTPVPTPQPTPVPTPAPGKPTAKAAVKPLPQGVGAPAKGLDLSKLAASIPHARPARPSRPFSLTDLEASLRHAKGAPGPTRPPTVVQSGSGTQDHVSASDVGRLGERLGQLWNTNCDVEGASDINIKVRVHVAPGGQLNGPPELVDRSIDPLSSTLIGAAAHRALSAVVRGAPFTELPSNFAGDLNLNFNAKQACARR